jgi:haloacid dehalogenase-like hydrolase
MAPQHPEWKSHEPFKTVLANDLPALAHFSERDWAELIYVTHAGMSQETFLEIASQGQATAKHPRFKQLYTELVYQPMIEVQEFLRANQLETYIVTGGGQDFVRPYPQRVYGISTQQVIGSSIAIKYQFKVGKAELMRQPKLFFNDNYDDKAVGIHLFIGTRPHAAFGNSCLYRKRHPGSRWAAKGFRLALNDRRGKPRPRFCCIAVQIAGAARGRGFGSPPSTGRLAAKSATPAAPQCG